MSSNGRTLDSRALLGRILGVLGVASLAGCAGRAIADEAADETEAEAESESSSTSTSTSTSSTTDTDTETETEDEGTIFDIGNPGDGDGDETEGNGECSGLDDDYYIEFVPPIECLGPEGRWGSDAVCFYPPDGVSCESEPFPDECILDAYGCGLIQGGDEISCGPFTTDTGACCYVVLGQCAVGRPWIVDGRARLAGLEGSDDWADGIELEPATLDADTRAALADAWASEGLGEHASIAAFSRFTMQLIALGAPRELVRASIRAGLDEVRHARACFTLASAYAGTRVGPGPLDVRGGLAGPFDLESVALTLATEGCIAETVSVILLAAARDRAKNPVVRAMLAKIVDDEQAHVLLAWEALAWMCRRGQRLDGLLAVFREAEQHVGFGATTERAGDPAAMREHGYLSIEERREIATRALRQVVAPAARELFAQPRISMSGASSISLGSKS
jgi:hypothetical protein